MRTANTLSPQCYSLAVALHTAVLKCTCQRGHSIFMKYLNVFISNLQSQTGTPHTAFHWTSGDCEPESELPPPAQRWRQKEGDVNNPVWRLIPYCYTKRSSFKFVCGYIPIKLSRFKFMRLWIHSYNSLFHICITTRTEQTFFFSYRTLVLFSS